ncbi:MAG: hypothetical protein RMK32_02645 [Anaerolineae bacterium]|nr:hypothetical protein [Anaerolineae bacterium]
MTDPPDHPLALAVRLALARLGLPEPDLRRVLRSELPIAGGLGSGAAVSAALVRAVFGWAGVSSAPEVGMSHTLHPRRGMADAPIDPPGGGQV